MHRLTRLLTYLFALAIFAEVLLGCGVSPESTAETSSALTTINYICVTYANDPASLYPWQASWPIGTQHPFCQNIPNEVPNAHNRPWPPGISKCPTDGTHAGPRQVDVWTADNSAPTNYMCARVTLAPAPAHFTLDYLHFLEMGWLSASQFPSQTRMVTGLWVGPGSNVVVESRATANPLGCTVPVSGCASMQVPPNGVTSWMPVTGFQADALNFYAP